MNWIINILDEIKWKATEITWAIQDKIELWKESRNIEKEWDSIENIEEVEVKPKKKKVKKKSVKKTKKTI